MPPERLIAEMDVELMELPAEADELSLKIKEMPDAAAMHAASFILGEVSNLLAKYAEKWDEGEYD